MSGPAFRVEVSVVRLTDTEGEETIYSFTEEHVSLTTAAQEAIYDLEQVAYYRRDLTE